MEELIKKYELSYEYTGNYTHWDYMRPTYNIYLLDNEFKFYGAHQDYKDKKQHLTSKELLWAFRCIISDAISYAEVEEYGEDAIIEFGLNFGYIDSRDVWEVYRATKNPEEYLSTESIEGCENLAQAFEGCESTWFKLELCKKFPISEDNTLLTELYQILETLSDMDIE